MARETLESDLLQQARTIVMEGRINAEEARRIVKQLHLLRVNGDGKIVLFINSNGGDVEPALDIFAAIEQNNARVEGVLFQQAHSVAALILQACGTRSAHRFAKIIIHDNLFNIKGTAKMLQKNATEIIAMAAKRQRMIYEIFAKRTGQPADVIEERCGLETTMTADEAHAFGLIDKIL